MKSELLSTNLSIKESQQHIEYSYGVEIDDIFRRRGLALAKLADEKKIDTIIYLDKSARPVSALFESAWTKGLKRDPNDMPTQLFMNVGGESKWIYTRKIAPKKFPENKQDLEDQWGKRQDNIIDDLYLITKNINDKNRIIIVDEIKSTGISLRLALRMIEIATESKVCLPFWLIEEPKDIVEFSKKFGTNELNPDVPWKRYNLVKPLETSNYSIERLLCQPIYDPNEDDLHRHVAKKDLSLRLEFTHRLIHYFDQLYPNR